MIRVHGTARGTRRGDRPDEKLGPQWDIALARLAGMRGTEYEQTCRGLLTHIEAGWRLVRPLVAERDAWAGEDAPHGGDFRALSPDAVRASLDAFTELEILDAVRWLADTCAEYVCGRDGPATATLDDLAAETERMVRSFHVLLLAVSHPAAPADYRKRVEHGAGLGAWLCEFKSRFEPFARLMEVGSGDTTDGT